MKRDFLKNLDLGNGAHLSDDLVEQIMAEAGKTKTEMQNAITSLTTERDGLKTQLSDANATIQSYKDMDIDGIKQSAADWETKYNTDTQALKDQLESTKYGYAVENAVGSLKFTSESAKKAFLADLTAKKLPIQEGKLLGLEDFAKIDWILISPPHAGRDPWANLYSNQTQNFNPPSPCGEGQHKFTKYIWKLMHISQNKPLTEEHTAKYSKFSPILWRILQFSFMRTYRGISVCFPFASLNNQHPLRLIGRFRTEMLNFCLIAVSQIVKSQTVLLLIHDPTQLML